MFWIFSDEISKSLTKLSYNQLTEIRIRNSMPVKILYNNKWGYISNNGFTISNSNAIKALETEAQNIAIKASENSLYSICDNIAKGFITMKSGARIGLCGEAVSVDNKLKTFKNFSSAIIRIPHEIIGASNNIFRYIHNDHTNITQNSIIISPPGGGKTTVLRDIAKRLSEDTNTIIIDERYEIASTNNGKPAFDVGCCDVISGCNKQNAIENAIRSCAPEVIITDEISGEDYEYVRQAISSGVNLITSIHSNSIENLLKKPNFEKFLSDKIFDLFIVLQGRDNPGNCIGVYDNNLNRIF